MANMTEPRQRLRFQVERDGMTLSPLRSFNALPRAPHENVNRIVAAKSKPAAKVPDNVIGATSISNSLASILRPQAAYRWLLPYVAAITPQYIETTLRGALAGNHVQAWELFDLMWDSDPEIQACIGEYTDGVLAKQFVVEPYAEENEEPSDTAIEKQKLVSAALRAMRPDPAADENDLKGTVKDILAARFHGQSVLEIDWTNRDGTLNIKQLPGIAGNVTVPRATYWVHPICYAWAGWAAQNPQLSGRLGLRILDTKPATKSAKDPNRPRGIIDPSVFSTIVPQSNTTDLVDFSLYKFLIGLHKAKTGSALGASVLRSLAWWWCASNFCGDWLLNAAQLFGIPFRKAKMGAAATAADWNEMRQMLQACGSTGYMLMKDINEVEFMEAQAGGGNSPQAFLFHFADAQKRKVILRQTMTGGQHGAAVKGVTGAFGETESDTKKECIDAGAEYASSVINLQLVPAILTLNYGPDGDLETPTVRLVDDDDGSLADAQTLQIVTGMIDVPDSYIRRKFRVPKVGDDDEVAGVDVGTAGAASKQAAQQAKQNADAQAQRPLAQPGQPGTQDEPSNADDPKDKGEAALARRAIEAAAARGATIIVRDKDGTENTFTHVDDAKANAEAAVAGAALHETVAPMLERLQAIADVPDVPTQRRMLQKFLRDHDKISAAMMHDDGLAKTITPELVRQFIAGMKGK